MKKFFLFVLIFILFNSTVFAKKNVFIIAKVNEKIITNLDIEKEASYLKILNPQLEKIEKDKILKISKNSLINEIIKKDETKKFFDYNQKLNIADKILKDFQNSLGFKDKSEFLVPALSPYCPKQFINFESFISGEKNLKDLIEYCNTNEIFKTNKYESILSPILSTKQNIMCMGLNYRDHIEETGTAFQRDIKIPKVPIVFTKSVSSINHPFADIPYNPSISKEIDWEVELAVVISDECFNVSREDAYDVVFGYTIINDISARDIQRNHKQFFLGKSLPGSCPIGPCIVTKDEVEDPHSLNIECCVNGIVKQKSNTKFQIFDIPKQIETITKSVKLFPGDVIATGTPSGVGFARNPPEFLKNGDVVSCKIEKIGQIENKVTYQ